MKKSERRRNFNNSIRLENFTEEEVEFLEDISIFSNVKTSIDKLEAYTSVSSQEEFCEANKWILSSSERLKLENYYVEKRNFKKYDFPIGVGSFSVRIYFLMKKKGIGDVLCYLKTKD